MTTTEATLVREIAAIRADQERTHVGCAPARNQVPPQPLLMSQVALISLSSSRRSSTLILNFVVTPCRLLRLA
jgi:hypothetical protein